MSSSSNPATSINLEFVRKEAKSLLKLCRSRDMLALARIRAELPRFAEMDDEHAAAAIKLADIHYALARESGFPNWGKLKRYELDLNPPPDFNKPGADGTLPEGFNPWRWCLSYTVRPDILSPLALGREYSIAVSVLRRVPSDQEFEGYATLYDRATAIAKARVAQLRCSAEGQSLQSRILNHGWFRHKNVSAARAFLTIGVACVKEGDSLPGGEGQPTREELKTPGGMTPDKYTVPAAATIRGIDEAYVEGDGREQPNSDPDIFIVSYGKYVQQCEEINYKPFVERAEALARFHYSFMQAQPQPDDAAMKVVRREWFCATNPNIVVVHVYIDLSH
jgi:hypothetical protein